MIIRTNKTDDESRKRILMDINAENKENTEKLCEVLIKNKEESAKQPSKVSKPAKVSAWTKYMSLEVFEKTIQSFR